LFLASKLLENGWVLSKGGRFHTLLSAQADKGRAMRWLADVFQENLPIAPVLLAIGDSPNDFPMLEAADFPFLVQRHDGTWAELELPHLNRVAGIGPKGFSATIQMLMV
jgi:mannosyl-3-phosphoglycerate phosphatase